MNRWHSLVGNGPRGQLPPCDQVARLVWQERHYLQRREVHIRSRHCWIRWIWGNTWQRLPSQKYLRAIRSFPTPQNITDIRSWFGLINQVAHTFSMTERMSPFCSLLKPDTPFQWDDTLQKLFEESKTVILDEICKGVKIFDKRKPTCMVTDWSKDGIGFWLLQKHCDCQTTPASKRFCCHTSWQIVLVGSRFTHSAESRYRSIEGEALADALDKTRYFVLGCKDLTVFVDHNPYWASWETAHLRP